MAEVAKLNYYAVISAPGGSVAKLNYYAVLSTETTVAVSKLNYYAVLDVEPAADGGFIPIILSM
jgi:hypothetical protein